MEDSSVARVLESQLNEVQEDQIVSYLVSALGALAQALRQGSAGAPVQSSGTHSCAVAVRNCCCVLQRAARLASHSGYLLVDLVRVVQNRLHGQTDVAAAMLDKHLPMLLARAEGFELVMRSLPADHARENMLYKRILALTHSQGDTLAATPVLVDLAHKELLKLMRETVSFDAAGNLQQSNGAPAIQIAPHLPPLLDLALVFQIRGWETSRAEAADTMASNVGEETAWLGPPSTGCGGSGAMDSQAEDSGEASSLVGERGRQGQAGVGVRAAAAVLQFLMDPAALLEFLDLPRKSNALASCRSDEAVGDRGNTQELLEDAQGRDSSATCESEMRFHTLLELVELLLRWAANHSDVMLLVLESKSTPARREGSGPAPRGAVTMADSNAQGSTHREFHGNERCGAASSADIARTALQLLDLHAALTACLPGGNDDSPRAEPCPCSLGRPTVHWLMRLIVEQLEGAATLTDRPNTRRCAPRLSRPLLGTIPLEQRPTCVAPSVAAHLLNLARRDTPALTGRDAAAGETSSADEAVTGLSGVLHRLCLLAFQGPARGVNYGKRLPTTRALQDAVADCKADTTDEPSTPAGQVPSPGARTTGKGGNSLEQRPSKRMRMLPSLATPATSPMSAGRSCPQTGPSSASPPPAAAEPTAATGQKSRFYAQTAADTNTRSRGPPGTGHHGQPGKTQNSALEGSGRGTEDLFGAIRSEKGAAETSCAQSLQSCRTLSAKPRRIAPTPLSKEEALSANEASPLEAQLLGRQDELEAYWEHYISVKEELVEQVLRDDVSEEELEEDDNGSNSEPGASPAKRRAGSRLLGKAVACSRGSTAFTEPDWQGLHAAAILLLKDTLASWFQGPSKAQLQRAVYSCCEPIWEILGHDVDHDDRRQTVMRASTIMDPCISRQEYCGWLQGGLAYPRACIALMFATRLAAYCGGKGSPLSAGLAVAMLQFLETLVYLAAFEEPAGLCNPGAQPCSPLLLLSRMLLALLQDGRLNAPATQLQSIVPLLRCILPPLQPVQVLALAAAALWATIQGIDRPAIGEPAQPQWLDVMKDLEGIDRGWLATWLHLPAPAHRRVACAELLAQCRDPLLELLTDSRARTGVPGSHSSAEADKLAVMAGLAHALRGMCGAVLRVGRNVVMRGSLREILVLGTVLLTQCAAAVDDVICMLAEAGKQPSAHTSRASSDTRVPPPPEGEPSAPPALPSKRRSTRSSAHTASSGSLQSRSTASPAAAPAAMPEEDDAAHPASSSSVAELTELASAGALLSAAARKLLCWRVEKCPRDAREHAEALSQETAAFEGRWAALSAARRACADRLPSSNVLLEEVEDCLGRALTEDDDSAGLQAQQPGRQPYTASASPDQGSNADSGAESSLGEPPRSRGQYQPKNAYVRAALAEARSKRGVDSDDESGYSDLEDFIVCKPGRDYQNLIAKEFKYSTA